MRCFFYDFYKAINYKIYQFSLVVCNLLVKLNLKSKEPLIRNRLKTLFRLVKLGHQKNVSENYSILKAKSKKWVKK